MSTPASPRPSAPASAEPISPGWAPAGPVLSFRTTAGWGNVPGNWAASVSTNAATFEAWIRTSVKDSQTIVLGSNSPGATPRVSVGGDQISVYWNAGGAAPGWTSADTTPVTDGRWHHIAVVFDQGAITFYKDGVATTDQLTAGSAQQAAGDLQLGAGFGATTGFVGQMYGVRVWSVARTAQQIASYRWAPLGPLTPGLTVVASFDPDKQEVINQVGSGTGSVSNCTVVTTDLAAPSWALSFSGGDQDNVSMTGVSGLTSTAATLECWVKMSTAAGVAGNYQTLMALPGDDLQIPGLAYTGDDRLGVVWGGITQYSSDTRPVSDGGWHHVAVVFDHGYVTLYKDGVATADSFQVTAGQPAGTTLVIGNDIGINPFDGELYDVRAWNTARTASEISSFRYATLQGSEPGLAVLCNLAYVDPYFPQLMTPINQVTHNPGQISGQARLVPVPQAPLPQAPSPVWTYELAGEAPVGPVLTAQGLLCTDNNAAGAGSAFLRSVDLQTGQVKWSYDIRQQSQWSTAVIPAAVGTDGQTAYVGVQTMDDGGSVEIHAVSVIDGSPVWPHPAPLAPATTVLTRPVVLAGTLYAGVNLSQHVGLAQGDPGTGAMTVRHLGQEPMLADYMTDPVVDAAGVYLGWKAQTGTGYVAAFTSDPQDWTPSWQVTPPAAVTADLVLGGSTLYVPAGGTILALNTADGSVTWSQRLSGSVNSRPVLLGSTLYAGCEDGTLYALDAATGTVQWQVDTRSPISTGLVNEDGVLYFATAGDDAAGPAFWAVDANSGGNDVLSYPVPGAGTIAFDQGGLANGVAYFYGTPDSSGANLVYAVNMSSVIHEFAVNSKLIVENYDTSTSTPAGNDTSYRVTLAIRDENGLARPGQAVKLWTTGTLSVVNQGSPITLAPDSPTWMETDASGNLTLALSAYDNGQPGGGSSGSPNLACPPLFAWANFMAAGEAIVIYPDHESLTQLSNVQGTSTSDSAAGPVQGSGTAAVPLDQATGYDGSPLISSSYRDPASLTAIAATVRNTVGTRTTTTPAASRLAGRHGPQKYVRPGGVLPNVVYAPDATAASTRPYVPGAEPVFTADLTITGKPIVYATTYDPARPSSLPPVSTGELGGIFSDIEKFKDNVIHGAEKVAKMAWKFADEAVITVIHTAEAEYDLAISDLEDAVTAVAGFFKSVVDDIKKAIEWLSALFNFKNILKNHAYIKNAITNPADPANPGILDRLVTWIKTQQGGGTDFTSALSGLAGHASAAVGSTAQGAAGQTVQSQQNGNSDPNAVYNHGGNNNANQCTWMHQKVMENTAGAPPADGGSAAALADSFDPTVITDAFEKFLASAAAILKQDFADLPGQIEQAVKSVADSFKDPKTLLSTALSDLMTVFQDLADDFVKFAQDIASDILNLIAALLEQVVSWLTEPVSIPFVSNLYQALTGDPLSVLDLTCLLAAVPGTILLEVLTGSPTVPDTDNAAPTGALRPGEGELANAAGTAGRILLGFTAYEVGQIGVILDTIFLGIESRSGRLPWPWGFLNRLDFAVDFTGYALQMVTAFGWSAWEEQDWAFWILQSVPQAFNFAYQFRDDGTNELQAARDVLGGVVFLIVSSVYAHDWPSSYKDAPKAPGLVLSANVFGNASGICELILLLFGFDQILLQQGVKLVLGVVGNILGFTANVLGLVDS